MNHIRWRLLGAFLLVALLLTIIPAVVSGTVLRNRFLDNLEIDLAREAKGIAVLLREQNPGLAQDSAYLPGSTTAAKLETLVREAAAAVDARITVVDPAGRVLADSESDPGRMENHRSRPEVAAALAGKEGRARRESTTLKTQLIYVAVPLDARSGAGTGAVRIAVPVSRVDPLLGGVWWFPLLVALVALAPILVLVYFLSRSITDPIERLQTMAGRMAEGDLSYRVGTLRKDELGRLGASLNDMADQLEHRLSEQAAAQEQTEGILAAMQDGVLVLDRMGQVMRANTAAAGLLSTSVEDMEHSPLVHSARALAAAPAVSRALLLGSAETGDIAAPGGRQLVVETVPLSLVDDSSNALLVLLRDETARRTTDRVRRDFVANVSHELKTPLARLSLLASTLDHAIDEDPDQARAFATILSREIATLTALVNDLLTLSQIEEQEQQAASFSDIVDLADVCREVGVSMEAVAANQGLHIHVEAPRPALVRGDRTLLITLLRNLADNALRYNRPEGHVWVSVRSAGPRTGGGTGREAINGPALSGAELDPAPGEVLLTVADDGLGIPREQQDRIFERFYRVDVARTGGGTGLGLSIVRHIAERHGATVEVTSAVGVGSRFGVRFPIANGAET